MKNFKQIKQIVKDKYQEMALKSSGCGCGCKSKQTIARQIGYTEDDINLGSDANLGLGCGNPVALSSIKEGDVVLDLGCGAGFDCFLAAKKVGIRGKVIGVDMTEEMIAKARINAEKLGYKNVEFIVAEIEKLPLKSNSVDIIISNCVINLSPDKDNVFLEAYRVLKADGKAYVSDIVLLSELTEEQKNNEDLLSGCVAGALMKYDYLGKIKDAGFRVDIMSKNKNISKQQYQGINLESLSVKLTKQPLLNH